MSLTIQTAVNELTKVRARHRRRGGQDHRRGPAAGRPGQLRRHSVPAVPGHLQVRQGAGGCWTAAALAAAMQRGRGHCLWCGDEARRGHGADRLPAGRRAGRSRPPRRTPAPNTFWSEAIRAGHETLAQTIDMNPVLKKAGRGGRRRQGLPHHSGGYAARPCGASTMPRGRRRTERPRTRRTSRALSLEDITFTYRHGVHRAQEGRTCPSSPSGRIWTASATAWSSARTTRPSRSTSTPTSPARP